jgi:PAT family beta-lactamase induction signal transducer AmpG
MPHPPELARATEKRDPKAQRRRLKKLWGVYRSFFAQPHAVLVLFFMFFYKLGDIMMFAMSKPLLRDIGIDTSTRGYLNGAGTVVNVLGTILGAAIIARLGFARCLVPITYIQNFAIPLYILMAVAKPGLAGVVPIVMLEQLASGLGYSTHTVFLMQRSRTSFSASHFAFATAVVSLGSMLSGYFSGRLDDAFGHPWFFTIAFLASVPSLVLVLIVPKSPIERGP